eukprot:TRINITY_DN4470_c0_g1_i1.p7 TRINITY_DN4470_c0_g1~~TRINITY_DN4470_c0_g1_i1.p7  ORF type:complete len:100 (+),score=4.55 TRINITY_DN4470_c0_g1_i1:825-1124(+)
MQFRQTKQNIPEKREFFIVKYTLKFDSNRKYLNHRIFILFNEVFYYCLKEFGKWYLKKQQNQIRSKTRQIVNTLIQQQNSFLGYKINLVTKAKKKKKLS